MVQIIQKENLTLRETSKDIKIEEITGEKVQKVISDMVIALEKEKDGVAIAAPQIGISLNIFVISHRAFEVDEYGRKLPSIKKDTKDLIFINPKILKLSKKTKFMPEGCLSVRGIYGKVKRATRATIKAYDEKGVLFTRGSSGLIAQIYQHETDHLKGVLFSDKAIQLETVNTQKK